MQSTEFGLSRMIWSAVAISRGKEGFAPSDGQLYGLYLGLLVVHGGILSLATKKLSMVRFGATRSVQSDRLVPS